MTDTTFLVKIFALLVFVAAGTMNTLALRAIRRSRHRSSLWFVRGLMMGDGLSWVGGLVVVGWMLWGAGGGAPVSRDILVINTWILLPMLAISVAMCAYGSISRDRQEKGR